MYLSIAAVNYFIIMNYIDFAVHLTFDDERVIQRMDPNGNRIS